MNHYIKITEMNIIENYEKWLQKRIDNFGNENIINVILLEDKDEGSGTKYDDFYKFKKLTPVQCTNRTFNRLNNALIYAEHQFYKILSFALKNLGRKQKFSEMHWYRNKKDNNCNFYDIFN